MPFVGDDVLAGEDCADVLAGVFGDGGLLKLESNEGDSWLASFLPATLKVSKFLARSNTTMALKWKFPETKPSLIH